MVDSQQMLSNFNESLEKRKKMISKIIPKLLVLLYLVCLIQMN